MAGRWCYNKWEYNDGSGYCNIANSTKTYVYSFMFLVGWGVNVYDTSCVIACFLILFLQGILFLRDAETTKSVELRCKNSSLTWYELDIALIVYFQSSYTIQLIMSFFLNTFQHGFHIILYALDGSRITDVVCLNVWLSEKRVVHFQLLIESESAQWRQKHIVIAVKTGINVMCNEASKPRYNHAIIA